MHDSDEFSFTLNLDPTLTLVNYYWHDETYRAALELAGLGEFTMLPWQPSPEAIALFGQGFWQPWLDNPSTMLVSAVAPQ